MFCGLIGDLVCLKIEKELYVGDAVWCGNSVSYHGRMNPYGHSSVRIVLCM